MKRLIILTTVLFLLTTTIAAHAYDWEWGYNSSFSYGFNGSYFDDWADRDTCWYWAKDATPPTVTTFTVPASATTLVVPVSLTARDNVGVTGYLVSQSAIPPSAYFSCWTTSPPKSYTFTSAGTKTLYAWARDAAGNVSTGARAYVTITPDTSRPLVNSFTVPATAATLVVPITGFTATDNVGVTGYLVNESATTPAATSSAWTASPPASYTFTSMGTKTLYAWARDAAGNVSTGARAYVTITPDTSRPLVNSFTVPATAATLVVPITGFTATDNVGVTGYLVNESATTPAATSASWTVSPPASYTFTSAGTKTLYAWARDAAGNISAGKSATIMVVLPAATPVLIVTSASSPFSGYYAEILRAEGLNAFTVDDISSLSPTVLAPFDVVVLGEMPLTTSQVTMMNDYVNAGGKLIAMRPDKKLASLLGLSDSASTLANAYLVVNTLERPGVGIVSQSMQFHGTADRYTLNGASSVATIYSDATTATSSPAVTLRSVGALGGQAAAFAYDLARSVVYTRQGNPAWEGQDRDGVALIRPDDLFYGAASFDPQPDWVDLNKVAIPQADEQQRLLANLIIQMNLDKKPLPRFWYLPRNFKAVVVLTGDDHGEGDGGTAGRFDTLLAKSAPGCSVENWECLRGTSYVYSNTYLTELQASAYDAAGFEVGLHVSTNCADWTPSSLETFYSDQLSAWKTTYASLPAPVTTRTHCVTWSDYATQPKVELAHGLRLDANYYFYPPNWIADRPGFFTGSGMPMRFADANGSLIDVYQAVTQMTDESGQSYPFTIDTLLDRAIGQEGYYGVFTVNAHTDHPSSGVSDAVVGSAINRGIPVISARQILTWLDGRNASTFNALSWQGNILRFSIRVAQGANGLVAMVPVANGQAVTRLTQDGNDAPFTMVNVKGMPYARFLAANAAYQVEFTPDATPPEVSGFTPGNGTSGISPVTDVAVTLSELIDPATINAATFELRDPARVLVPAKVSYDETTHLATLHPAAPLALSTTYTATVKGGTGGVKDLAGNPLAADFTWWFTTAATRPGPFSIWSDTTVPGVVDAGPDSPVELGVKFRSATGGFVTGIRFYKASTNTGDHPVSLWTGTGTLLATATLADETASGWQQVNFFTPVAISADTVYVASYHTSTGHFSIDYDYFTGKAMENLPLQAIADGAYGVNGVFAYGLGGIFPNQGYRGSNYWVDVVFQP